MAGVRENAFPIKKLGEDRWEVDMEGNKVHVASRADAELIALIPVEINKTCSNTDGSPDTNTVKKIIEVCHSYHINASAIRQLKAWLKENQSRPN